VIYELAFQLHMPVYELADNMPYLELLGWMDYFERRPIGWREDDRTHKILQSAGVKAKGTEIFASLARMHERARATVIDGQISTGKLQGSSMFAKLLSAKGGDNIGEIFDKAKGNEQSGAGDC